MANMTVGSGVYSVMNLQAAAVIKTGPSRLVRISVITSPTGTSTFNDCTTTGAATQANEIFVIPSNAPAGTLYYLDWPCALGIVCSSVGASGVLAISFE